MTSLLIWRTKNWYLQPEWLKLQVYLGKKLTIERKLSTQICKSVHW